MKVNKTSYISCDKSIWLSLNKQDSIEILENFVYWVGSLFNDQIYADITTGTDSGKITYNIDEFKKEFSCRAKLDSLIITASVPEEQFFISFSAYRHSRPFIMINSYSHSSAEIDDLMDEILDFIMSKYEQYSSLITSQESKDQIPVLETPKVHNLVNQRCCSTDKCNDCAKRKFYETTVFWTAVGAIAGIGSVLAYILLAH